jgi:hypothetical protein
LEIKKKKLLLSVPHRVMGYRVPVDKFKLCRVERERETNQKLESQEMKSNKKIGK